MENVDEVVEEIPVREILLTTKDNPWDPFTQNNRWREWDNNVLGYHTEGEIAKRALFSENLTPLENEKRRLHAIVELLEQKYAFGVAGLIGEYCLAIKGETTPL